MCVCVCVIAWEVYCGDAGIERVSASSARVVLVCVDSYVTKARAPQVLLDFDTLCKHQLLARQPRRLHLAYTSSLRPLTLVDRAATELTELQQSST
jgi:hypothetical protein